MGRLIPLLILFVYFACSARNYWMVLVCLPVFSIAFLSVARIESDGVTPDDMIHLMMTIFFVISPMQSFDGRHFDISSPVRLVNFQFSDVVEAQAIVALCYVSFVFVRSRLSASRRSFSVMTDTTSVAAINIGAVFAFAAYVISCGGIANMLATRYEKDREATSDARLFCLGLLSICVFTIWSHAFQGARFRWRRILPTLPACGLLLVAQNPYNTARNAMLSVWLPLITVAMRNRVKASHLYIAVILAIIFVMPVVNLTSREGYSAADAFRSVNFMDVAEKPFSDAFDLLPYEVQAYRVRELSYGWKTVGLYLFIVPRTWWPGKPTLTGLDLGDELVSIGSVGTDNLSFFVGGDFYADFWLVGAFVGGGLVAVTLYLAATRTTIFVNGWDAKNLFLLSGAPILIRGPLGANVGLFFCQVVCITALAHVFPAGGWKINRPKRLSSAR